MTVHNHDHHHMARLAGGVCRWCKAEPKEGKPLRCTCSSQPRHLNCGRPFKFCPCPKGPNTVLLTVGAS